MPRKLALILVVPILVAVAATTGVAAQQQPPCSAPNSRTIYRDASVRVYRRDPDVFTTRFLACLVATGQRRMIEESDTTYQFHLRRIKVAAPWIAYVYDDLWKGDSESTTHLCALNLRTGARNCGNQAASIHGFGVTRAGSIAWLEESWTDGSCCYVYAEPLDAPHDQPTLLDSGPDIDKTSFAVGGQHIYWTKAGEPKSATMP